MRISAAELFWGDNLSELTRHQARIEAFELIFEQIVTAKPSGEILVDAFDARDLEIDAFAKRLFLGAEESAEKIDEIIGKYVKAGWSVKRISKVSYAILRLAVYELLFCSDIPVSVSINEAVELAKEYGNTDDSSYVNGVLSSVEKAEEIEKDE